MNKQLEKTNITKLKDKKLDIKIEMAAMILTVALGLGLTHDFYNGSKTDIHPKEQKFWAITSGVLTAFAAGCLAHDVKQYKNVTKEIAEKAKENQK